HFRAPSIRLRSLTPHSQASIASTDLPRPCPPCRWRGEEQDLCAENPHHCSPHTQPLSDRPAGEPFEAESVCCEPRTSYPPVQSPLEPRCRNARLSLGATGSPCPT